MNKTAKQKGNDSLFVRANTAWDRGDLRTAFKLFNQAADSGDASSQLDLGYFYDRGLFVRKDKERALHWYYKAYRQGDRSAANNIATVYREAGNARRMIWWFRRAVAMGDDDALLELGKNYETGTGVSKNPKQAQECYRRLIASNSVCEWSREQATKRLTRLQRRQKNVQ